MQSRPDVFDGDARFAPPAPSRVALRQRVVDAVADAVEHHRVTLVTAPSGMGKTVAVTQWARQTRMPVAWLSLSRHDADAKRLSAGVVLALRGAALRSDDPELAEMLGVDADSRDDAALYAAVSDALTASGEPIALVIDDLHRAKDAVQASIVGALLERAPTSLRIVLISRENRLLPVDRLLLAGDAASIGADVLRLTSDETRLAAEHFGVAMSAEQSERLSREVDGWAAAVRLALVSGEASSATALHEGTPSLTDFIADEVLGVLPAELREFVLAATTTSVLDGALAETLTGRVDASSVLEECVRRGLFLDRYGEPGPSAVYRWHSVFAVRCRAVLERDDSRRARRLHRVAAEALAGSDPLRSIDQWIAGGDVDAAVQVLRDSWVALLLGPNGDALDHACRALAEPWASDPEVLMIRACAIDVGGNRTDGQRLFRRARSLVGELAMPERARAERTADVAGLYLHDSYGELVETITRVRAALDADPPASALARAGLLLLIGVTMVYQRVDIDGGVETLSAARAAAIAIGESTMQRRATGMLAFMLAFRGDFERSRELLADLDAEEAARDNWQAYIGGAENTAAAWVAFWSNDLDEARTRFRRVIESGAGPTSFAGIARHYLGIIAAVAGDRRERAEAIELLRGIPETELHGVPWPAYRMVSLAMLAAAEGRNDRAAAIITRFERVRNIPAAAVLLAGTARRVLGDADAVALLRQIRETGQAPFVRASSLVTLALVQRDEGNIEDAHELLEHALDLAAPRGIRRPFADDLPELRALLREHGAWGSTHTGFIASLSAPSHTQVALSDREREVFGYLRTDLRLTDIAEQLGLSVNTVKTHTRTIYRKLGVSSRREAVRAIL